MKYPNFIRETDPDCWICVCGNEPGSDGFYPCNSEGEEVEPTPQDWPTNCYVCAYCGRIINQNTLEIVGARFSNTLTEEEKEAILQRV